MTDRKKPKLTEEQREAVRAAVQRIKDAGGLFELARKIGYELSMGLKDNPEAKQADPEDEDRQTTILLAADMATQCRKPTDAEHSQVKAYVILAVSEKTETVHVSYMAHDDDVPAMLEHVNALLGDMIADHRESLRDNEDAQDQT